VANYEQGGCKTRDGVRAGSEDGVERRIGGGGGERVGGR